MTKPPLIGDLLIQAGIDLQGFNRDATKLDAALREKKRRKQARNARKRRRGYA